MTRGPGPGNTLPGEWRWLCRIAAMGGVGPMTITMLLHNTIVSAEQGLAGKA